MATTTFQAIRNQMTTTIKAITPTKQAGYPFVFAPATSAEFANFRTWADDNDQAALRMYTITHKGWEVVGVSDLEIERRTSTAELVVAYPHHWRLYGPDSFTDLENLVERDMDQLVQAIGRRGGDNYASGQNASNEVGGQIETGENMSFASMEFEIEYCVAS